jgi:hypothetical protein
MRLSINYINKLNFLAAYPQARINIFKIDNIKYSFTVASLVLFNPN